MVPAPATAASAGSVPSSAGEGGFEPLLEPAAGRTAASDNAAMQISAEIFRFILNCSFQSDSKFGGCNQNGISLSYVIVWTRGKWNSCAKKILRIDSLSGPTIKRMSDCWPPAPAH